MLAKIKNKQSKYLIIDKMALYRFFTGTTVSAKVHKTRCFSETDCTWIKSN